MKSKLLILFGALTISPVSLELAHSKQVPNEDFVLECLHKNQAHNPNHTLFVYYTSSKKELIIRTTINRIKTGDYVATFDEIKSPSHSNSILNIYAHMDEKASSVSRRFNIFVNKDIKIAGLIRGTFDIETHYIESGSSSFYKTCRFKGL